jgi:hypothetical protein
MTTRFAIFVDTDPMRLESRLNTWAELNPAAMVTHVSLTHKPALAVASVLEALVTYEMPDIAPTVKE